MLLTLAFGHWFTAAFVAKGFIGDADAVVKFLFIGCAGLNFVVEFCVNLIATPLFYTVIKAVGKSITGKQK